jgi:hypothetical protein
MEPIGCPKMSVQNYHSTLHNFPEQCKSQDPTCTPTEFKVHKQSSGTIQQQSAPLNILWKHILH